MKILLLGASGYLGSNIAAALTNEGHEAACVIRPSSYARRLNNMRLVMSDSVESEFSRTKYDWVINSACAYRENECMINSNLVFPLEILNLAAKYHVPNFMTIGTSLPDNFNMYSFTKAEFSRIGKFFSLNEKLINFAEIKLEMFYGGMNEPSGRFIKDTIMKLIAGNPVKLTQGTQKRDIIHVHDAVNIILRVIRKGIDGFSQFPAGSGENHSIREIIQFLKDYTGSNSPLEFGAVPSRKGEPDTLANIGWYREIDYTPEYSFFDGLKLECGEIRNELQHRLVSGKEFHTPR